MDFFEMVILDRFIGGQLPPFKMTSMSQTASPQCGNKNKGPFSEIFLQHGRFSRNS